MTGVRVVIVGGGPAGVRAAETLVANGCAPVLIDEADRVGGQIYRQRPHALEGRPGDLYGFEARKAVALHETFARLESMLDYRPGTLAWNVQDGTLHLCRSGRLSSVTFDALILATGATDRMIPLRGWTLPGVYTLGGAQIALKYQACTIGRRTAFVGSTPLLYLTAYQYARAGADIAALVDTGTWGAKASAAAGLLVDPAALANGVYYMAALRGRRVPQYSAVRALEIHGARSVETLRLVLSNGEMREIACDAVAMGFHLRSETQLAELAGCRFEYDPISHQWTPAVDADGRAGSAVYLAGDGMKLGGADAAETSGSLAALAVLVDAGIVGPADPRIARLRRMHRRQLSFQRSILRAFPYPQDLVHNAPDDVLLCRCEGVTVGAYRAAAATGLDADDMNRRKAFSRVGMGRCQGRYCGLAATDLFAMQRNIAPECAGRLRAQAPVKPLPLVATPEERGRAA